LDDCEFNQNDEESSDQDSSVIGKSRERDSTVLLDAYTKDNLPKFQPTTECARPIEPDEHLDDDNSLKLQTDHSLIDEIEILKLLNADNFQNKEQCESDTSSQISVKSASAACEETIQLIESPTKQKILEKCAAEAVSTQNMKKSSKRVTFEEDDCVEPKLKRKYEDNESSENETPYCSSEDVADDRDSDDSLVLQTLIAFEANSKRQRLD
jgi:hypothetical protein